jgi:hypothetical protein
MNTDNSKTNVPEHNCHASPSPTAATSTAPIADEPSRTAAVPRSATFPPETNFNVPEGNSLRREDLHIRAGSLLARLTVDQRTQLFKWLLDFSVADVLNFVAAPPPRGFGIQTHKTTLRRIKGMIRSHSSSAAFETSSATAELLTETIQENRPQFAPLISELLLQKAFDQAADASRNHDLKDLVNSAIKLRELELKVQRLQLLRERQRAQTNRRPRIRIDTAPSDHPKNEP